MKLLVCIVVGFAIFAQIESRAVGDQEQEQVQFEVEEQCVEELNLNREELMNVVDNPFTPLDIKDYGKFFVCVWEKRGVMNKDGTINHDGLTNFFRQIYPEGDASYVTVTKHIGEQCLGVEESTPGKTAIQLKNCLLQVAANLRAQAEAAGY